MLRREKSPNKPFEGEKFSKGGEAKVDTNGQPGPPVRIYPLIPPALPDYLKRRRRRKRRGGGGHE